MNQEDMTVDYVADLSSAKERSKQWLDKLTTILDGIQVEGLYQDARLAIALFQLSIDHHLSIRLLIDNGMLPSAKALYRPQLEAYVRGLWIHLCAIKLQIDQFLNEGKIPSIGVMLNELEIIDDSFWKNLRIVKDEIWSRLCDLTHGGSEQALSRFTKGEIGCQFSAKEALGYLMASTTLSYMAGLGLAAAINNENILLQLHSSYHQIFLCEVSQG